MVVTSYYSMSLEKMAKEVDHNVLANQDKPPFLRPSGVLAVSYPFRFSILSKIKMILFHHKLGLAFKLYLK